MLASSLVLPPWVENGIRPNHKGSRINKIIYGADTETVHGKPLTLQFFSEQTACDEIHFVGEDTALKTFLKWCARRVKDCQHVVYVHNLEFDLPEFLWGKHPLLITSGSGGDFDFKIGKWRITGVYGGPTFAKISDGHHRVIFLVDSFSWYRGALSKAANLFCPHLPKLKPVPGLGEKKFTARDSAFVDYAMRDAVVAYHIGVAIEAFHKLYDLQQCLSVADMAARIFRHRFLTYTMPLPSREITDAAFLSYHGGKNNLACKPGWYDGVTSIDISSAYPWTLHGLPAYSNVKLYRTYRAKGKIERVPDHGVYLVDGTARATAYPVLFSHSFKPLTNCDVEKVWVQGYELNEAIASGDFKCQRAKGYWYDAEKDHQAPAFRGFVEDFYQRKETETDKPMREMYKFTLNSVSGKLIQTRKRGAMEFTDVDSNETLTASDLVAGGMFHPWLASEVTARPRARICRMEREWGALHTATDGILSTRPLRFSSRDFDDTLPARKSSRALGRITVEATDAQALIARGKLYVLYGDKTEKTTPSKVFKGKHIIKNARHGFQGTVTDLERMMCGTRRTYMVNRPNKLKTSLARGLVVNKFEKKKMTLHLPHMRIPK